MSTKYVNTNEEAFRRSLQNAVGTIYSSSNEALRKVGLRLARRLMAFTPPKTLQEGMAAVGRDIRRAVRPLSVQWASKEFTEPRVRNRMIELIEQRSSAGILALMSNLRWKRFTGAVISPFDPSLHTSQRDSRGRVRGDKGVYTFDMEKVGEYIRGVQQRVGMAKGGWHEAVEALGGSSADWIARHRSMGSFDESQGVNAFIKMVNRSPWGKYHHNAERTVSSAMRSITQELVEEIRQAQQKALSRRL